jgi:hypothetical protein
VRGPHRLLAGVAVLYEALALVSALALHSGQLTWWFLLSGALTAAVALVTRRLTARPPGDGPSGGPGGPGRPLGPPPPPPWWPGWEAAFREYAEDRERTATPR